MKYDDEWHVENNKYFMCVMHYKEKPLECSIIFYEQNVQLRVCVCVLTDTDTESGLLYVSVCRLCHNGKFMVGRLCATRCWVAFI